MRKKILGVSDAIKCLISGPFKSNFVFRGLHACPAYENFTFWDHENAYIFGPILVLTCLCISMIWGLHGPLHTENSTIDQLKIPDIMPFFFLL